MVIGIIGEHCSGKSTLAKEINKMLKAEIITGKDYLRMAKSESEAIILFRQKLESAIADRHVIYVMSEKEHMSFLPDGALTIYVKADLKTIQERFKARMHGKLPEPVARMLERKHGMFDGGSYDYEYDGTAGNASSLCAELKESLVKLGE